jgi:hypothetical protein
MRGNFRATGLRVLIVAIEKTVGPEAVSMMVMGIRAM